jgi:hypothetical protein
MNLDFTDLVPGINKSSAHIFSGNSSYGVVMGLSYTCNDSSPRPDADTFFAPHPEQG